MRTAVIAAAAVCLASTGTAQRRDPLGPIEITSPGRAVVMRVVRPTQEAARLTWLVTLRGRPVIEPSPLGIVLDGQDLGEGATVTHAEMYRVNEKYPWRGV